MPVKAYNLIKIVKYYYSPLCYIYYIIIIKLLDISKDMALQIVSNNFTGFDGLIPTLLVFRAYLYIVKSNTPNFTVI